MKNLLTSIKSRLVASKRVLVTSHIRPDGDAIGSCLALALALKNAGKTVQVVLADEVPPNFKSLPGVELVTTKGTGEFDLVICVDSSDLARVGDALLGYRSPDIVIDHHITSQPFGSLNLVEPDAAATASVLMRHFTQWGLKITPQIGINLAVGLLTDTLGFRTSNTTSETLRQAAELMDLGVDFSELYHRSLIRRTFVEAKYWGAGLSSLSRQDGIVWVVLTLQDRIQSGYPGKDDADLVNVISSISDADVAVMFVEQEGGRTKVSWRALKPDIDVTTVASYFKGGGHKAAAGAELMGTPAEVKDLVLDETQKIIVFPRDRKTGNNRRN